MTCEALYHLLGGKAAGWVPHSVKHEGDTHWYLMNKYYGGLVLDPTVSQFETRPDYLQGRGRGFMTKGPSKRAQALMAVMVWQS